MVKKVGFPLPHFSLPPDEIRLLHRAWFALALHLAHFGVLLRELIRDKVFLTMLYQQHPAESLDPKGGSQKCLLHFIQTSCRIYDRPNTQDPAPDQRGIASCVHTSDGLLLSQ